jgi:transposase
MTLTQFVRPYVKSQKNDAADAEAICEAVQRSTMRFVPVKGADQQAVLLLHRLICREFTPYTGQSVSTASSGGRS